MSKEIIEFLKSNRVPYYLWTDEERAVADRIPRKWWLLYVICDRSFCELSRQETPLGQDKNMDGVYCLKPDYEPEPESQWIESEIKMSAGTYEGCVPGVGWASFHMLNSFVGFGGVQYEDCECGHLLVDIGRDGPNFSVLPVEPCEKHGPHRPLKARFWGQKA